jgi:WD40-like Beta Propeller Repeat
VRSDETSAHPTQIIAAATLLAWTSDGRLLFTREREGASEVFGLAMVDGRPVGEPTRVETTADLGRLVPHELAFGRGAPALGLTTSGALIYGQTRLATDAITVSIDPDTSAIGEEQVGRSIAAYGIGGVAGGVRYSPDGTRALYTPTRGTVVIQTSSGRTRTLVPQLDGMGRLE